MENIKKLIKFTKQRFGDNDTRANDKVIPCAVTTEGWACKEIDRPGRNFDWKEFWRDCKTEFPLHSIAGGKYYNTPGKIIKCEYNRIEDRDHLFDPSIRKNKNVLEIGYGYGGAAKKFHELGFEYYGIDYVSSGEPNKKYGTFIEIDKSGIPKELMGRKYGVIYSENVFQHMTKKQRIEYYKQASEVIEPDDGMFFFSLFTRNDAMPKIAFNANKKEGKSPYATQFFGVHTYVPTKASVRNALEEAGFDDIRAYDLCSLEPRTNDTLFIATKSSK